jgi:hypothetical protein
MKRAGACLFALVASCFALVAACTGDDAVLGSDVVGHGVEAGSDDASAVDGGAQDAAVDAAAKRISVAGKVITNAYGVAEDGVFAPLTGAAVAVYVGGKRVTALTAGGTFAMDDVAVPYDAFVIETSTSVGTRVQAYLGLTRPDPVLFGGLGGGVPSRAYTQGTLTPGPQANEVAVVAVAGEGTRDFPAGTSTSSYAQAQVSWGGEIAPQVKAAAYTLTYSGDLPTTFPTYGITAPFIPVAGGAPAVKDITMNPIVTGAAHVAVTVPATLKLVKRILSYRVLQGPTFRFDALDPTVTTLDFGVPTNATAEIELTAVPQAVAGGGNIDTVQQVLRPVSQFPQTLNIPTISSRLDAPSDGTIASGKSLTWSATPKAAYRMMLSPSGGTSAETVVLVLNTASTSLTFPDLTKVGVALTPGVYTASLTALSPFNSLDDICGPNATLEYQTKTYAPAAPLTAK